MKIVDVQAIHMRIEDPAIGLFDGSYDDCVIVVRADNGMIGIGECESYSPAIVALVQGPSSHNHAMGLRQVLVGQELTDPRILWQRMYESTDYVGRRGLVMHAIGGLDLALWDLAGQAQGKPVHELLGGAKRHRLEAYGTIYPMGRSEDEVRKQIQGAQAMKLRNFKFAADPWWMDDLALTGKLLMAARREAGEKAKLIVDAALSYRSADEGLKLLPLLLDAGVWFLEAPLPLDDMDGHARMAGRGLPLGVGDLGLTHVLEFIEAMDRGKADICQPDITMVGGFTGMRTIAQAAFAQGKRVIPHGYKTNIEIAANLHVLANFEEESILEYSTSASPLRWKTTIEKLPVEDDGFVRVPTRPGLGVTLDWDFIEQHRRR